MKPATQTQIRVFLLVFTILSLGQQKAFPQLFGPQQKLTSGTVFNANTIRTSDFNNDSLPDVVCNSFTKVIWYKNLGEGKFDFQETALAGMEGPSYKNVISVNADFDGDGDVDIAYYPTSNWELAWNENDGSGSFDSIHPVSDEFGFSSVSSSDFDGDGDMDLLVIAKNTNQLILMLNDGIGNFPNSQIVLDRENGSWVYSSSDIDGDGDLDIVVSYKSYSNGEWEFLWIENDGNANFGTQHTITDSSVQLFHIEDMDNDDNPDILCAIGNGNILEWLENDGSGIFGLMHAVDTLDYSYHIICTADIDNDGDRDIISSCFSNFGIFWYENTGSGSFSEMQIINNAMESTSLFPEDLDGDGFVDLSVSFHDSIVWYKNQTDNSFSDPVLLSSQAKGAAVVCTADLDGDGDEDIISSSWLGKIAWYENIGYQTFAPQSVISYYWGSESMITCDVDNDLDQDIVSAYILSSTSILWWANNGHGDFDMPATINDFDEIETIASADFNDDGNIDILAVSYEGIQWHENLGGGTFAPKQMIKWLYDYNNTAVASDLDGDQDIDVLYSNYYAGKIVYYKNDGEGNFDDPTIIFSGEIPNCVRATDLTNDGNNDIIASINKRVVWFKNLGNGSFGEEQLIADSLLNNPKSLYSADVNNDGFKDILYGGSSSIFWHQNLGNGNFGNQQLVTDKGSAASIFCADIDNDGDLDALSAGGGTIAWYENLLFTNSVNESSGDSKLITLYPNPATNWLTIQSSALEKGNATIELFDLFGRLIQSIEIPNGKSSVNIQVDHLQKGMYIVKLNDTQSQSCKLIKN